MLKWSYFVFGIPLLLKQMSSYFLFDENSRYIQAWVQIHGLPLDGWTLRVVSLIGSKIDKPLYTDKIALIRE